MPVASALKTRLRNPQISERNFWLRRGEIPFWMVSCGGLVRIQVRLRAMASNLLAMASNLIAMASNLIVTASNL